MTKLDILEFLDLDKAKPVGIREEKLSSSEATVMNKVKDFGIDLVYFNKDEEINESFPVLFLKNVESFTKETLIEIAEVHRKAWNYKKVLFLYVYSKTEIRIYNCCEVPIIKNKASLNYEKEIKKIEIKRYRFPNKDVLTELNKFFSRAAIDSGSIWVLEDAKQIRGKINLQKRVDKHLATCLVSTANKLKKIKHLVEHTHKIMFRSIFLLYLEDTGATDENFYGQIKEGATSYLDILDDVKATKLLYRQLYECFGGELFKLEKHEELSLEKLQLIKECFIIGNHTRRENHLPQEWRLFDFNIIQIELISVICEIFIAKTTQSLKKVLGTYYTPPVLADFVLKDKLPTDNTDNKYNVKVLDPCCGSGIFLVESFKRLVKRYENDHKEKLTDIHGLRKLLTDNIFGIEIYPQIIKVAAFSLYF